MAEAVRIDLIAEDKAHEELLQHLIRRVARELEAAVTIHVISSRGGHPQALREFKTYQLVRLRTILDRALPDILIVCLDSNCSRFAKKREEIRQVTDSQFVSRLVTACPDPHIERWYLADPSAVERVVGSEPPPVRAKCRRQAYKDALEKAVKDAGHPRTLSGLEFAHDLASQMDLYRAGKEDHSLGAFVDDLRAKLKSLASEGS